jgi:hypothetical protein
MNVSMSLLAKFPGPHCQTAPEDLDEDIPEDVLKDVLLVTSVNQNRITVVPVLVRHILLVSDRLMIICSQVSDCWWDDYIRRRITACIRGLGFELAKDVILDC